MKPCIHICTFYNADESLHSQTVNTTFVPDENGAKMLDGIYKRALNESLERGDAGGNPKSCNVVRCTSYHMVDGIRAVADDEIGVDTLANLSSADVAKVQQNLLLGWLKFGIQASLPGGLK